MSRNRGESDFMQTTAPDGSTVDRRTLWAQLTSAEPTVVVAGSALQCPACKKQLAKPSAVDLYHEVDWTDAANAYYEDKVRRETGIRLPARTSPDDYACAQARGYLLRFVPGAFMKRCRCYPIEHIFWPRSIDLEPLGRPSLDPLRPPE